MTVHFNVRVLYKGDKYGRDHCLTHEEDRPMVEFYDARWDHKDAGGWGQFVSRYYLDDILSRPTGQGLDLQGDVPSWKVTPAQMIPIMAMLRERSKAWHEARAPKNGCTYPRCKCIVSTSTSAPEPKCPKGFPS